MARHALLAASLLLLAACGGGNDDGGASTRPGGDPGPETEAGGAITVPLREENNSGTSGTATLARDGGGASVTIELRGGDASYHAHVHDVSCGRYRRMNDFDAQLATVAEGLTDIGGGASQSDLGEPLSSYTRAEFSINVHEFDPPYPVVACGDVNPSRAR